MESISFQQVNLNGESVEYITVTVGDNSVMTFPADPANHEYCAWAIAEGLVEAPVVVEPEVVEPEPVIGTDPEV